jgi:hypothetical protein
MRNKTFRMQKNSHKLHRQTSKLTRHNSKGSFKSKKNKKKNASNYKKTIVSGGNKSSFNNLTRVSSTTRKIKPRLSPPTMLQSINGKLNKSVSFLKHAAFTGRVGFKLMKHYIINRKNMMKKYN